jgi:RND family efflux transporter MFP subunit
VYIETSGTVAAAVSSIVAAKLMATVTAVFVDEGDHVQKGDLLVSLDDSDIVQKIKQAEAGFREAQKVLAIAQENLSLADITLQRFQNLFDGKALSKQELDQAATRKKVAEHEYQRILAMSEKATAGLAEAKIYQGYSKISAPISGLVTTKNIEPGNMSAPGMPLLTIADTSALEIKVPVSEQHAGSIGIGQMVLVDRATPEKRVPGKITEIVPAIDPRSRKFSITIAIDGTDFFPGTFVKVSIPVAEKNALLVPDTALLQKGQLTGVYAIDQQDVITYRLIRVGKHFDGTVEILSGLQEGEEIISEGVEQAADGGQLQRM